MSDEAKPIAVLVVEDEALVRMNIVESLQDDGFDVIEAENGPDALDLVVKGALVDVLFTDVNMPGDPDGIDLAKLLCERMPKLAVIISSGRPLPPGPVPCGGRFMPKPYTLAEVGRLVRRVAA